MRDWARSQRRPTVMRRGQFGRWWRSRSTLGIRYEHRPPSSVAQPLLNGGALASAETPRWARSRVERTRGLARLGVPVRQREGTARVRGRVEEDDPFEVGEAFRCELAIRGIQRAS